MQEIISCPSCQRKLQVPETLVGQDVQCPTCGATFVAAVAGPPAPPPAPPGPPELPARMPTGRKEGRGRSGRDEDTEEYEYEEETRPRRRRRRDLEPHRGGLILALGILSIVTGLGFILGPIAWAMGQQDLREIREGRMDPEGEGTTNGGRVCGIIGTVLGVLYISCCFLGMFAAIMDL